MRRHSRPLVQKKNPTYNGQRAWLLLLSVCLCPKSSRFATLEWNTCELVDDTQEHSRILLKDAIGHLRLHAAVNCCAIILIGIGTFLFAFTFSDMLESAVWAAVGLSIIAGVWFITPRLNLVKWGCPLFERDRKAASLSRHLPPAMVLIGALLIASTSTFEIQSPVFDGATLAGTLTSGIGILGLGITAWTTRLTLFRTCLYVNALGALLISFGDTGWAITLAPNAASVAASATTAGGCVLYALFINDLVTCFKPPTPGTTTRARRSDLAA